MKKYIIFDMDGTLLDTELLMIHCWEKAAEKYGILGVADVCHECIGTNSAETEHIFQKHYGQVFPISEIREEVVSDFKTRVDAGPPLKPFAKEILQYLKSAGFQIAVASSTVSDMVKKELSAVGCLPYFDYIVGGDMASHGKPAPDIFLAACKGLGCNPKETLIIEDSFYGIQAAYAAGAIPLMVPDLIQPSFEIRKLCRGVFADLLEVQKYIEGLCTNYF